MKLRSILFSLLLLLTPIYSHAQVTSLTAFRIRAGATLPATCTANTGAVFFLTTTDLMYICTAANTWTALAASGGSGSFSSVTDSGLTATRVTFAGVGGLLSDDADMTFVTNTLSITQISMGGSLTWASDNATDIGASGATRPRTAYIGTSLVMGANNTGSGAIRLANNTFLTTARSNNTTGMNVIGIDDNNLLRIGSTAANLQYSFTDSTGSPVVIGMGTPTVTGDGTIVTGSQDSMGKVTSTVTAAATITVTFATAFTLAPACVSNNGTTANLTKSSSTTTVLTITGTTVSGDSISYICLGF